MSKQVKNELRCPICGAVAVKKPSRWDWEKVYAWMDVCPSDFEDCTRGGLPLEYYPYFNRLLQMVSADILEKAERR